MMLTLTALGDAMREVNAAIEEMRRDHDPLASHIFVSRRHYRNAHDTKGGKRREVAARLSYNEACALGFQGRFFFMGLLGGTLCLYSSPSAATI